MPNRVRGSSSQTITALARHSKHYRETMGAVPESLREMAEIAPAAFEGYSVLRHSLLGPDREGRLQRKYRHLLCAALDCANHNLKGAENHIKAGIRAGLTPSEVADGMLLLVITCGTPAWGQFGRHVTKTARAYAMQLEKARKTR